LYLIIEKNTISKRFLGLYSFNLSLYHSSRNIISEKLGLKQLEKPMLSFITIKIYLNMI